MEDALFEFKVSRTYQGAIEGRGIKNPADLIAFFYERVYRKIDAWQRENCVAVYLDAGNHILGWELLSIGTSCRCLVDTRALIRSACLTGAASVALAHNHPSFGDCKPSKADIEEASRIQTILKSAGITLLDFVILTQDVGGYTFAEERVIKCEKTPENGQETQKEQKPAELSEEDEKWFKEIELMALYFSNNTNYREKFFNWLNSLHERFNSQSKQEWSDEDKKKISELKTFIAQCNGFNKENRKKAFDMIDALCPRPNCKPGAEWSEEDELFRQQLIVYCENCVQDSLAAKCVDWLKSLRPQPRWKPSQEQIVALGCEMYDCKDAPWYNILLSLYEDLKKL